jgi:hypothetical protein
MADCDTQMRFLSYPLRDDDGEEGGVTESRD